MNSKKVAVEIGNMLLASGKFHRSQRAGKETMDKGRLVRHEAQVFEVKNCDYAWDLEADVFFSNMMTGLMMAVVLSFTLLPIWPMMARQILGYTSVTLLLILSTVIFSRIVLFLFMWLLGYDFWVLPNLFDEGRGVADSFKPVVSFSKSEENQGLYRFILFLILCYFVHWGASQPDEFQSMLDEGNKFVDDMYSGKLLTDFVAANPNKPDHMGGNRFKSLQDLLDEEEREKIAEAAEDLCRDTGTCPEPEEGTEEETEEEKEYEYEGEDGAEGREEEDE